jgi:hypothetical protein
VKLLFKRIVRTSHSEQYGLFDQDQLDEDELPQSLGIVDLHYTAPGTFATVLLWVSCFEDYSSEQLRGFVEGIMDEFSAPMGVPGEFLVNTFMVGDKGAYVYSNMAPTDLGEDDDS